MDKKPEPIRIVESLDNDRWYYDLLEDLDRASSIAKFVLALAAVLVIALLVINARNEMPQVQQQEKETSREQRTQTA